MTKDQSADDMVTNDEFERGCDLAFRNLLRAAVLRERAACAKVAREAMETWKDGLFPSCCEDIAWRIEMRA